MRYDYGHNQGGCRVANVTMQMIHASTKGRIADLPDNEHAYLYHNCVQQKPEDAHLNAENYGMCTLAPLRLVTDH